MKDKYIRYISSILWISLLFLTSIELNSKEIYDTNTHSLTPTNICQLQLTVINSGDRLVNLYKINGNGINFVAIIAAGNTYITIANEDEFWFVNTGPFDNSGFYQIYDISGCNDQVFQIHPDYKCLNKLTINNNGDCEVSLYKGIDGLSYNTFETNIPANSSYTVLSYEGEKWQAVRGSFDNLEFDYSYIVSGCASQTFNIDPNCPCTIDLQIQNNSLCIVHLYKAPRHIYSYPTYITSIPSGESYIAQSCLNEKWRVVVCDSQNILFDENYVVSGINNQIFNVYPTDCPCNENL